MPEILTKLMKRYAEEAGLSGQLAEEAAEASADEGRYMLDFGGVSCALALEKGEKLQPDLVAAAHFSVINRETADPEELLARLKAILGTPPTLAAAVPVFNSSLNSLGIMARRPVRSFTEENFLDWMNDLERTCREAENGKTSDNLKVPGETAKGEKYGRQATTMPLEPLLDLFSKNGAPLPPGNGFWKLPFQDAPIFISFNPYNGRAEARTLLASDNFIIDDLLGMLSVNLSLGGDSAFALTGRQIWLCTPFYPETMDPADLPELLSRHQNLCANARNALVKKTDEPTAEESPMPFSANYLRV